MIYNRLGVNSKALTSTVYALSAMTDTCKQTAVNRGHLALVCLREVVVWQTELVREQSWF
jgi:hypothetical protein